MINFFDKLTRQIAEVTAQSVNVRINEQNDRMREQFGEINERLRRIETRQKETSIQIEEIDGILQGDRDETVFIDALVALVDIIGDFYYFAAGENASSSSGSPDQGSALFEQAQMMWNTAKNEAGSAGLTVIDSTDEPFDFNIHSIEATAWDDSLPAGYVIKTIKCGYIFNDGIIRQAAVIINKQEIIYL